MFGDEETCYDTSTRHSINEAVPGRGFTTTYNWNLILEKTYYDIENEFYSVFGRDKNNKNRISKQKCLEVDCFHECYMIEEPSSDEINPCLDCLYDYFYNGKRIAACDRCSMDW